MLMPQIKNGDASLLGHLISYVQSHECPESIIFECAYTGFNFESFHIRQTKKCELLTEAHRHYSKCRINHIPGIKM